MLLNKPRRIIPNLIIGFSIAALVVLFFLITQKLNVLREAPADNVTWGLSQLEVDLLRLRTATMVASQTDPTEVENVRKRFNNVYSRVTNLRQARGYANMRANKTFGASLDNMASELDALVPLIDGAQQALRAGLPTVLSTLDTLSSDARIMALAGIELNSQASDSERSRFSQLLWATAVVTGALVVFLIVLSSLQIRQYRAFLEVSSDVERANTRLNSTFEVSLDAIIVADEAGIILEFNEAAEGVFGFSRDEVVGEQMADLIVPPHLREAHLKGMERFNRTKQPRLVGQGRIEITAIRKSGEEFPIEITIGQTTDKNGTIFVSYLRDITQRLEAELNLKQARDDALQAEKAKSNFLAVMSHEMRTPLNGIFGTIELMRKTDLSVNQADYLDIAQRSGDILLHHVNDVLDITRMDEGELRLSKNVFDLRKFFEDVVETNEPTAISNGNKLLLDIAGITEKTVLADEQRLRQVAFNLISNALKFTDRGSITLSARTFNDGSTLGLEFKVSDTGFGISKEDQRKVFDRFFTQEKSYDRMASGAGLGLAICKQIVDKMGGEITLESALGEGSTFTVNVPVKAAERLKSKGVHTADLPFEQRLQGAHVLLVEDNEINRLIVREMLEREGAKVSEAHNGLEAVDAAMGTKYSAILMDISMPKMNGIDATAKIRTDEGLNQETPILALTAHALKEEQEKFFRAGMNACLNKPVTQAELAKSLEDSLKNTLPSRYSVADHQPKSLIDDDIFDSLQTVLRQDKLEALVHKFDAEIEGLIDSLPDHLQPHALVSLGEACHRSVGAAGMMGAVAYQADLRKLEQAARAGNLADAKAEAMAIKKAWPDTRNALLERI